MFERMENAEYIYECVVEPNYKKHSRSETNRDGHGRKNIGEAASSQTYSVPDKTNEKYRKGYVDRLSGESKTYLIL